MAGPSGVKSQALCLVHAFCNICTTGAGARQGIEEPGPVSCGALSITDV